MTTTNPSSIDIAYKNLPLGAKSNITNWTFKLNDDLIDAGAWGSTQKLGLTRLLSQLNSKTKDAQNIRLPLNHYINRTRLYLQMYKNNSPVTLNAKLQSLAKDINDISSMLEKKQITPKQLAFYYSGDPDQPVNVSNI
jgi:hypothetical protein